ncbi:MAG: hypothetical protein IJ071_09005 [Ruminococcus sp.]|nr:hypothetical protein [Ruminococcus sp.]
MRKIKILTIAAALLCLSAGCSDGSKDSSSRPEESAAVSESSPEESSEESRETPREGGSPDEGDTDFGTLEATEAAKSFVKAAVGSDLEELCRLMYPAELAEKEVGSEEFAAFVGEATDELVSFNVKSCTELEDDAVEGAKAYYQALADQYGIDLGSDLPTWGYELEIQWTTKNGPEPIDGTLTALNIADAWKFLPMGAESAAALKEMNGE